MRLWPFGVAAALGLGVVFKLVPAEPAPSVADAASVADDVTENAPILPSFPNEDPVNPALPTKAADAAPNAASDAGAISALLDAAAAPQVLNLSPFEREERAKDALDRAEQALRAGQRDQAKAALDEAFLYDPEHPDIAALRSKL